MKSAFDALPDEGQAELFGHPMGVYVCFFTEMWERFSFYGMKALLLLYLIQHHKLGERTGFDVLGAYGGLVYCLPVLGGLLADRWLGMRKAVVFGGILLCLGHLGMAFEGHAAREQEGVIVRDEPAMIMLYLSLALIIMGVGFLKPNISTVVGRLYAANDPRRDSGFSLFYAGINLGALFASVVCGYLGQTLGWRFGFGAAGVGMLLGLAQFLWGQRFLRGLAEPSAPARLRERRFGVPRELWIYALGVAGTLPVAGMLWAVGNGAFSLGGEISLALALMLASQLIVLIWLAWFMTTKCTRIQRDQMLALAAMIFGCLVFFTLYEQTYGSWVTFTEHLLTKDLVPALVQVQPEIVWTSDVGTNLLLFAGSAPWSILSLLLAPLAFVAAAAITRRDVGSRLPARLLAAAFALIVVFLARDVLVLPQTAGSLTYLGALFIVLLAPVFTWIWGWLDRRGLEPSKPLKTALGLALGGLSFLPMALAAREAGATGALASVWWLVAAYFVLELGEMCLSPVGLSAVTQLSVPSIVSFMMGAWFLATAFSETLAASFGKLAAVDIPAGEAINLFETAARYEALFWMLTWIGLGSALAALVVSPVLRRAMHGVR